MKHEHWTCLRGHKQNAESCHQAPFAKYGSTLVRCEQCGRVTIANERSNPKPVR